MPILFDSKSADYFWLSNFSPHGFELDGKLRQRSSSRARGGGMPRVVIVTAAH